MADGYYPSSLRQEGSVWFKINAFEIDTISTGRGMGVTRKTETPEETLFFLAPNEIQEAMTHTWEPYETIGMRVAEFLGKGYRFQAALGTDLVKKANVVLKNQINNTKGTVSAFVNATKTLLDGNILQGGEKIANKLSENAIATRIDAPLVYKNSERRRYDLIFNLFWAGMSKVTPYNEVVKPVRILQRLSSPNKQSIGGVDSEAKIKHPYIFEINSTPNDYFHIENAALLSVQPTFRGPYKNGTPTSCELHLTFQEILPTWGNSYTEGSISTFLKITSTSGSITEAIGKKIKESY